MIFRFHREMKWNLGIDTKFPVKAHQLKKIGFSESKIIPQVVKLNRKVKTILCKHYFSVYYPRKCE